MNRDIYLSLLLKHTIEGEWRGMVVHIPQDPERLPGERIKGLTNAARTFSEKIKAKLRTEMMNSPPPTIDMHPLNNYLWGDDDLNCERLVRHLGDYYDGRKPHRFQPKVGIPVVMEEEFIGRKMTLAKLEEKVAACRSCHLRAPRRYGKTSLMGRLATKIDNAVMLELSDVGTPQGFFKMLLRSCMRHETARSMLHKLPSYAAWAHETNRANFSQVFNAEFAELMKQHGKKNIFGLLRDTMTALADGGIILLIDEFSLFLRDMQEGDPAGLEAFLEQFYQLRSRSEKPLTAVIAGSSGLSTYIELYGMHDLFADLIPIDIQPVTSTEARLLAEELFYGMEKLPTISVLDHLVELTGDDDSIPYFVQALASYTAEQAGQRREIDANDVESAYYDRLLGPQGNVCFRDFILRERAYPDKYRSSASLILKQLSRQASPVVADQELLSLCKEDCDFAKLMTCLEEDYDLVHTEGGWQMRSKVIADRWRMGEPWLTVSGN